MKKKTYNAIDIFSGAGGLSLGAQWAGIDISYAIEIDKSAAASYQSNHKDVKVLTEDIGKIDAKQFVSKENPVFIIMGGPPCQGFSLSNTKTRNMDNPKNYLFREFVRFVRDVQPDWFLFENVGGLTNLDHGEVEKMIEECFREIEGKNGVNYTVKSQVLWAHEYGVPQKRNRFFMVGNCKNIDFQFPAPLCVADNYITVEDAIGDLPLLDNGDNVEEANYAKPIDEISDYAKRMRMGSEFSTQNYVSRNNELVIKRYHHIPQGGNWRDIPISLMENYADKSRCHSGIYRRLCANKPAVVISNYRKSMLIHPYQDRGISVREAARLQSFPDTFKFEGPISHIQQQIGNAVPPLLAKAVFDQIMMYAQ